MAVYFIRASTAYPEFMICEKIEQWIIRVFNFEKRHDSTNELVEIGLYRLLDEDERNLCRTSSLYAYDVTDMNMPNKGVKGATERGAR
jgi:hypothetical protein